MRFYLHRSNDTFQQFKDKVEVVEHLLTPPVSIALIEANYQEDGGLGKRAVREIVQSTTYSVVVLIVLATALFVFSHELRIHPAWSITLFIFYLIVNPSLRWALGFRRFAWLSSSAFRNGFAPVERVKIGFLNSIEGKDEKEKAEVSAFFCSDPTGEDLANADLTAKDLHRRRFAIALAANKRSLFVDRIITNVPFSFRNLWLWSLVIGLCSLFVKKDYQVLLGGDVDNQLFQDFTSDFLRILLIAIVAYIATNVINELLQLREQYVQGKSEMASLKVSIADSTDELKTTKAEAQVITKNLLFIKSAENLQQALVSLREHFSGALSNRHPIDATFNEFLGTIKKQFSVFDGKVTQNEIINLWMLGSLNQYFKIASKEFEEHSALTTRFHFFGKILNATFEPILRSKEFLSEFSDKYEIFTVMVLPPGRFLNYKDGEKSDKDWDDLIGFTIDAKKKGLRINRHFLALDYDLAESLQVAQEFGEESVALKKTEFKEQLRKKYWFSQAAPDADSDRWIKKIDLSYSEVKQDEHQEGYDSKELREILATIHTDEACKVLEVNLRSEAPENLNHLLRDNRRKKPIDYFAIRDRRTREWLFCYRTVYDKTFDFAEIEILYKQEPENIEWHGVCGILDRVFLTDKTPDEDGVLWDSNLGVSIHPIQSY